MQLNAQGAQQDSAETAKWFLRAAEQAQTRAQIDPGLAYVASEGPTLGSPHAPASPNSHSGSSTPSAPPPLSPVPLFESTQQPLATSTCKEGRRLPLTAHTAMKQRRALICSLLGGPRGQGAVVLEVIDPGFAHGIQVSHLVQQIEEGGERRAPKKTIKRLLRLGKILRKCGTASGALRTVTVLPWLPGSSIAGVMLFITCSNHEFKTKRGRGELDQGTHPSAYPNSRMCWCLCSPGTWI